MHNHHEIERAGNAAAHAQLEVFQALKQILQKIIKDLAKAHGKGKETMIEIKVDGQPKLRGMVKDGVFTASKNELSADEIKSLKAYFSSLPTPKESVKDFEVIVDKKTVLKTENGVVVPQEATDLSQAAKKAFEALGLPSASEAASAPETTSAEPEQRESELLSSPSAEPERRQSEASPKPELEVGQSDQPKPTASGIPKDPKTGLIPPDYGIELASDISWEKLKASGDHNLMRSYGSLENIRVDLNDSYGRASNPGFEWIAKAKHIPGLEKDLAEQIPVFEKRLQQSIEEGKYPDPRKAEQRQSESPGLNPEQKQTNLEFLEKAKSTLALLGDGPVGERKLIGANYSISEGQDGSLSVTHKGRGEILNFSKGKVTGTATAQDVVSVNRLLKVAIDNHTPQQGQAQSARKSLVRGGITA